MSSLNILISGAGITGPILAHFLSQSSHEHNVTIVERSPALRKTGQNVDVRARGLEIIKMMGDDIEPAIRSAVTQEQGFRFVDANNGIWAEFPVGDDQAFTSELEIIRGELASILYESTKSLPRVQYIFNEHIAAIEDSEKGITAHFANDKPPTTYDIIIGADGWASRTRELAFGPSISKPAIKSLNQYTAYFKIPYAEEDGTWAQWYNSPGGRLLLLRPDPLRDFTRVWMSVMPSTQNLKHDLEHALTQPIQTQKQLLTTLFTDAGWRAPRILKYMQDSDDFYFQKIAQVKLPSWSTGRVVLVGDAAYAPSPISGKGTDIAITGAYALAQAINSNPSDHEAAFKAYETGFRDTVTQAQKLIPGAPGVANPQTWWGIRVLYAVLWVVWRTGFNRFV